MNLNDKLIAFNPLAGLARSTRKTNGEVPTWLDLKREFRKNYIVTTLNECWPWLGSKAKSGYGRFIFDGKQYTASRIAIVLDGRDIPEDMLACHKCDNPICVNPNHLFVGTQLDNMHDMRRKKRGAVGEKTNSAKLTEAKVLGILFLASIGRKQNILAQQYGVSQMAISNIVNRKLWRHVNF